MHLSFSEAKIGVLIRSRMENDENRKASTKDPLQVPVGPITRARAKKFKEALNGLIQGLWADSNCKMESNKNLRILNLIQADGGPSQT